MATLLIEWNKKNEPVTEARDAAFYCIYGHDLVGTVFLDGVEHAHIYCDGEMRFYPAEDNPEQQVLRDCLDLADVGILTDKQLFDAVEKKLWTWDMNPWFDFYSADGTHLDIVCGDIDEAIAVAESMANQDDSEDEEL